MQRGKFFVFEGIDGSGKTTQLRLFTERLKKEGYPCYETREPTDGPIGALVNQILKKRLIVDERATATLFAGDRLDHLLNPHNGLCTKIEQGIHVVSDRYYLSSYAYNGSKAPLDWVIGLNGQAAEILKPDAHIFVDVSPEVAVGRIAANRFETELYETIDNLTAVREQFYAVFDRLRQEENVIIVDGNQPPEAVSAEIWEKVKGLLEEKEKKQARHALYKLKFFFDWGGTDDCLWSRNEAAREKFGEGALDLDRFPLSEELKALLEKMGWEYQSALNWDDPHEPSPWSEEQKADFMRRSKLAYQRIVAELGEEYEVDFDVKVY